MPHRTRRRAGQRSAREFPRTPGDRTTLALVSAGAEPPQVDAELRAAAIAVLAEAGWGGVTLEKVADRVGRARVTLWRKGITREVLRRRPARRAGRGLPAHAVAGAQRRGSRPRPPGRRACTALCEVIDRHLPLVLASDTVFHQGPPATVLVDYTAPFARFVSDAQADGSLPRTDSPHEQALLAFNTVAWTYTHMRGHHDWPAPRARERIVGPGAGRAAPLPS